jgi:hypothetical protein
MPNVPSDRGRNPLFTDQNPNSVGVVDQREDLEILQELQGAGLGMELGSTGLKRAAGYVDEEFLPQLRGRKAVQVFKEMSENDPLVGALIHTITMLLRNVEWTVKPAGKKKDDAKAAELVETSMHDMNDMTWDDFITEALSFLIHGWSWHEIVYKRRRGRWVSDHRVSSKHNDNLIGWRRIPIRSQETMLRWIFDSRGEVMGMVQVPPPHYKTVHLPMQRSMLFRLRHTKGNPEGRSLLRNAYRPWYYLKRIQEYEAIGVERDLAGLPMVKVPVEYLRAKPGSKEHKAVMEFRKMVKSIRRDEQEGLVFPTAFDQDTRQPLFDFQLIGSGGGRQFQTDAIIQRYEQRVLMSVLADFIMVGHQQTGSYSLHTDKTGIFRTSLNAIAQTIADTLNRTAVPRLLSVNGLQPEEIPEITPTDVDSPDIAQLGQFMTSMASLGVQWFPDAELEKFVRDAARLPQMDDEAEEKERLLSRRKEATRFMQAQTEYVQTRQQLQQTVLASVGQGMEQQQPGAAQQPGQEQQAAAGGEQAGMQPSQPGQDAAQTGERLE